MVFPSPIQGPSAQKPFKIHSEFGGLTVPFEILLLSRFLRFLSAIAINIGPWHMLCIFRYTHIDMNFVLRAEPTTNHTAVSKIAQNYFPNAIIYVCSWLFMSFGTPTAQQPNSSHFMRNQKSCNYSWRQLVGHLRRSQKLNLLFFPSSAAFYSQGLDPSCPKSAATGRQRRRYSGTKITISHVSRQKSWTRNEWLNVVGVTHYFAPKVKCCNSFVQGGE